MATAFPLYPFHHSEETIDGIEVARMREMPPAARAAFPHRHDFYEIFWMTEGSGTQIIDFVGYPITPPCVIIILPGQLHLWQLAGDVDGYAVLLTPTFLLLNRPAASLLTLFDSAMYSNTPCQTLTESEAGAFGPLFTALYSEFCAVNYGKHIVLQAQIDIIIVQLQRVLETRQDNPHIRSSSPILRQYLALIEQHFMQIHQVSDYANLLGITAGHLADSVRADTGMTAGSFIRERIILEARRLLAFQEIAITDISQQLGFDDPSYFSRFFRRETTRTPQQFRSDFREKYQSSPD